MPSLDAAARNTMATAAAGIGQTLQIRAGSTVLATHTGITFGSPTNGVVTANAVSDVDVAETGTADNALLTGTGGVLTLTLGTSGAEVIVSTTSYVAGGTSTVNSISITYPAS